MYRFLEKCMLFFYVKGGYMGAKPIPAHMKTLADEVHRLRRQRRLSQAVLAKRAGMSSTTLSHIEQVKARSITVEHLVALAAVLETSPNVLLGMSEKHDGEGQPGKDNEKPAARVRAGHRD
jgi:transcriptional regulator with XRE-family HTH domain